MSERIKERKHRIALLQKMLNGSDEPTDKVLARFCVETGVTEFTARKYFDLLIKAGLTDRTL